DGARSPHRHHVDLAVADELLRLRSLAPPHFDMRLDLAHLAEGAIDIHGIELFGRHAVGQQRKGKAGERAVVEATIAGNRLTAQKSAHFGGPPLGNLSLRYTRLVPSE